MIFIGHSKLEATRNTNTYIAEDEAKRSLFALRHILIRVTILWANYDQGLRLDSISMKIRSTKSNYLSA